MPGSASCERLQPGGRFVVTVVEGRELFDGFRVVRESGLFEGAVGTAEVVRP